jgi:hypothetical protein
MFSKSIASIAFAVLCALPLTCSAQIFGHRAMGCGCASACDSCAVDCGVPASCGCETDCAPAPRGCRIKGLFSKFGSCGRSNACAPVADCCSAPAPSCAPAPTCCEAPACVEDPCCEPARKRCSFLSAFKARMAARKACCVVVDCCESAPAAPACGCSH